ncbi:MAG: threonine ammonia-lyase IlvA [Saprospiraceae bacterium]|nr:threonine ammonia-lyase IlvA [Saprospiraceae bacterium]
MTNTTTGKTLIPLTDILKARKVLKEVVINTPLALNERLSRQYNCNVFLKREDMQVVRSFKIRGAYYKIASLGKDQLQHGVICASAGNHAQGVAFSCHALEVPGVIFMPTTTPRQKVAKVRHFGGDHVKVVLVGDTYDDAQHAAYEESKKSGAVFVHPFEDEEVIAGQATVAAEIIDEFKGEIDYILVAVGGGGLISGIGSYFRSVSPRTKIIAIEAAGAPALAESLKAQKRIRLENIDPFADGIAVREVGEKTFAIAQEVVDKMIVIPEGKICSTILSLYNEDAIVVEPAGAIGVAALDEIKDLEGKNVVVIMCGGNNDIMRTPEIKERSLLWEGRKHFFIIRFPQRSGALKEFLNVLGPNDDIAHFEYTKKTNRSTGPALVGVELKRKEDYKALLQRMDEAGINYMPINNDPMLFEMLV